MAFKRALWSSGYTYQITCPYCRTVKVYTDRELDFRPWYPDGFIYCPRCRKPLRHNEIYAVQADGSPVFANRAEADLSVREGFYNSRPGAWPEQPMQPMAPQPQSPQPQPSQAFCPNCGRPYAVGTSHFCSACGTRLG